MKKIIILLTAVLLPFLASANAYAYDLNTAKKFNRVTEILKNAKEPFKDTTWWITGTATGSDGITLQRFYNTDKIKEKLANEGLDVFLKDENNRIVLSAVADYVTDHQTYTFHNDFEALLAIGIAPVEAAVRTSDQNYYLYNALNRGVINYKHCYVEVAMTSVGGHISALSKQEEIEAPTTEEEVEAIRAQLEEEKPLIKQFKKDMEQLQKEEENKRRKQFGQELKNKVKDIAAYIPSLSESFSGMGKGGYVHW